ncbi:hypothetical protein A2U01_0104721, partial [Trifolium medium]|nr:hypothetical protein [Trifolium medium]
IRDLGFGFDDSKTRSVVKEEETRSQGKLRIVTNEEDDIVDRDSRVKARQDEIVDRESLLKQRN